MECLTTAHILPDLLRPNLRTVFCGTAAGDRSAKLHAYYAGPGNKFWPTLHRLQLTPRLLQPHEFPQLLNFNIGLTDLAKFASGSDISLAKDSFDCTAFAAKINTAAPLTLAFNGKKAAQIFLHRKSITYGLQPERIATTLLFVLPSTSGAANGEWKNHALAWDRFAATLHGM